MDTCQICGREIKASKGIIAHHGYHRPSAGWQTKSCIGARHLPYEISCDVLPYAIKLIEDWLERIETQLHELMTNPPAVLTVKKKVYFGFGNSRIEDFSYNKPADFNPLNTMPRYRREGSYDDSFDDEKRRLETEIGQCRMELEYLQKRLADWKAPSA